MSANVFEQGRDPIEARIARRVASEAQAAKAVMFDECAEGYVASHGAGWRNVKHAAQWKSTLATYASPIFGGLPVLHVELGHVIRALEPIWTKKP